MTLGTREQEIMDFLHERVFDPILDDPKASQEVKQGVRLTIMRLNQLSAASMVKYFWSAIAGTERSADFSKRMKGGGHTRFEDIKDEFSSRFDKYLQKK